MDAPVTERILIVEDDDTLRETLAYNLREAGYEVLTAADGTTGLKMGREEALDLMVIDVMLPKLDGLSVCRILNREVDVPIILLTARTGEIDKIVGLDSGADDYITKPFSLGEFLARVRVALRRRQKHQVAANSLEVADLSIDLIGRKVEREGQLVKLSHKEFDLLVELIQNKGAVLSRDLLLTKVWGYDYAGGTRTVDVHVRWLREKIETDPSQPQHIQTIRGIGYRFEG
jgi:DNA-binding response OmpR family regulator